MNPDELAKRLFATFLDELDEQLTALDAQLLALEPNPADAERLNAVFRIAHTLKGAARVANVPAIEHACHAMEELLARARDGRAPLGAPQIATLFAAKDALVDAARRLRGGLAPEALDLSGVTRSFRTGAASPPAAPAPPPEPPAPEAPPAESPIVDGTVRIHASRLDDLVATAGQAMIAAARNATRAPALEELRDQTARWAAEWRPAARAIRLVLERARADPALAEPLATMERNLLQLAREMGAVAREAASDAGSLERVTADVMEQSRALRMRPFAEVTEALPRVVRDLAARTGKQVRLDVRGGDVSADRAVLDGMRDAVLQLVRNAVDHGVEPPEERERRGKPAVATLTVGAAVRGDRIMVTVSDDGAGLDVRAIRERLRARGVPAPDDEQQLARVLFEEGFSTRREADEISGRGVGLGIVQAAVQRIRGDVDVRWSAGRGTTFTMWAPLTLATTRALLVEVGAHALAVPIEAVERIALVAPGEVSRIEGRSSIATADGPVPLVALARILGPPVTERAAPASHVRALLLAVGRRRLAVTVDELLEQTELVVRPLDRRDERAMPHLSGAALLPTGRVALVLDARAVVRTRHSRGEYAAVTEPGAEPAAAARRRLLVADDSITTRTLEQSVLEAAGYDVITAVDGLDAWRLLQERGADLVITDIEMPRLDGFALCERIRASRRFQELPVVLVTSLETPEHRARGLEAGADAYIVKSSFDQQALLDTIRQLIG